MQLMAILLVIFAISMAWATFIERDYGTPTAQYLIFKAKWFEILLLLMALNLFGNVLINKLYRKSKLTIFIFHTSFIIIILGAAITRYFGYEGMMHIRENSSSNEIQTSEMFLHFETINNNRPQYISKKTGFTSFTPKNFKAKFVHSGSKIQVSSVNFIPQAVETVKEAEQGQPVIAFVYTSSQGRQDALLKKGEVKTIGGLTIGFEPEENVFLKIEEINGNYTLSSLQEITLNNMMQGTIEQLEAQTKYNIELRKVYQLPGSSVVFTAIYPSAKILLEASSNKNMPDALILNIKSQENNQEVTLYGRQGVPGTALTTTINGKPMKISFGPGKIRLPFALKLNDFIIQRYPGSNSPSSFASFVEIKDGPENSGKEIEISMNNILRYKGYRFYQSSYDEDEQGTILSVNKDMAGTTVTYIGYFLLALGMLLSVLNKSSRLQKLVSASKVIALLMVFSITTTKTSAQENTENIDQNIIPIEHARHIDDLMVQDNKGRLKPFHTYSSELLRKIHRKDQFSGQHSNQVILGMMVNPAFWQMQPMIKISHPEIKELLNIDGKFATFSDFFSITDHQSTYKLSKFVEDAFHKKPGERDKFDNELIKVDERLNICYLVYTGELFRVLPLPNHSNNRWFAYHELSDTIFVGDSIPLNSFIPVYFNQVDHALHSGHWDEADEMAELIKKFQHEFSAEIMPKESKIKLEILYNESEIFIQLSKYFGYLGIVFLIMLFLAEIKPKYQFKKIYKFLAFLVIVLFALQTLGLGVRWYISGHAPWSNGYESLIYIAWATVLAGIVFSRQSFFTLASTSLLASVILGIAHLSWMDPEITNLVPVLKSYWLTIHVSVITSSYGFFALAALLSFVNLFMMIFKSKNNHINIQESIIRLSGIIEMTIIIGLYLLSIGTFLGGVWANESWGRYWGWDPKETWALITVIVYAFIAHMRMIPGLKSFYLFNLLSLIGFGSVIMTYFGVNYFLAGLHSYAKGDPIPLPTWVYYSIMIIAIIAILAQIKNKIIEKKV